MIYSAYVIISRGPRIEPFGNTIVNVMTWIFICVYRLRFIDNYIVALLVKLIHLYHHILILRLRLNGQLYQKLWKGHDK